MREAGAALVMAAYNMVNGEHDDRARRAAAGGAQGRMGLRPAWSPPTGTPPAARCRPPWPGWTWPCPGRTGPGAPAWPTRSGRARCPRRWWTTSWPRLLGVARRVGALSEAARARAAQRRPASAPAGPGRPAALLRRAAAGSFVLLHNDGAVLPLAPAGIHRRRGDRPERAPPGDPGRRQRAGHPGGPPRRRPGPCGRHRREVTVTSAPGCRTWQGVPEPPRGSVTDPVTGEPGVRLEFRDRRRRAVRHRAPHRDRAGLVGRPAAGRGLGRDRRHHAAAPLPRRRPAGPHLFGAAGVGRLTITVNGDRRRAGRDQGPGRPGRDHDPAWRDPRPGHAARRAGRRGHAWSSARPPHGQGPVALRLGVAPLGGRADADGGGGRGRRGRGRRGRGRRLGARPRRARATTGTPWPCPAGRTSLSAGSPPPDPRTVVVVNAGMPVLMPWAGQVGAVIYAWLPGQAIGEALADVLLGRAEPGGRLPVTLPAAEADCPVLHAQPTRRPRSTTPRGCSSGTAATTRRASPRCSRSVMAWATRPGTTSRSAGPAGTLAPGTDAQLRVRVRNTGSRPGREVVQAYVTGAPGNGGRPVRVLGAFGGATAAPGEAAEVTLRVPARIFAVFDEDGRAVGLAAGRVHRAGRPLLTGPAAVGHRAVGVTHGRGGRTPTTARPARPRSRPGPPGRPRNGQGRPRAGGGR